MSSKCEGKNCYQCGAWAEGSTRGNVSLEATGLSPTLFLETKKKEESGFSKSSSYIAFIIYLKKAELLKTPFSSLSTEEKLEIKSLVRINLQTLNFSRVARIKIGHSLLFGLIRKDD
jgi:hypothetical protein